MPSTSRFKRKIRVFQSQIHREQQVVTWTAGCFFLHGKEKVFLNKLPKKLPKLLKISLKKYFEEYT